MQIRKSLIPLNPLTPDKRRVNQLQFLISGHPATWVLETVKRERKKSWLRSEKGNGSSYSLGKDQGKENVLS